MFLSQRFNVVEQLLVFNGVQLSQSYIQLSSILKMMPQPVGNGSKSLNIYQAEEGAWIRMMGGG